MKDSLTGAQVGTIHPDGSVTELANLTWTEVDQEHLVSQKLNNEDWDYYLVIRTIDLEDACGEEGFMSQLVAVSAQALGEENVKKAIDSCGFEPEDVTKMNDQVIATILVDYGYGANLFDQTEPTEEDAVKIVKTQAESINLLFGFYMDRAQNRIGATGWDTIKGELEPEEMREEIKRMREANKKA